MVYIYYEITIYVYHEIFPLGDFPLNPHRGKLSPRPPSRGDEPPRPPRGAKPPQKHQPPPDVEGCTVFMEYKHG
jgi:hypothetical protein